MHDEEQEQGSISGNITFLGGCAFGAVAEGMSIVTYVIAGGTNLRTAIAASAAVPILSSVVYLCASRRARRPRPKGNSVRQDYPSPNG